MSKEKKQVIKAEDLYQLQVNSGAQISPDGETIVYSIQTVDRKTQKKYSNLWITSTSTGKTQQFTYGQQMDYSPSWSPDGKQIAFLSNRLDEKQFQIFMIPFHGGEARPLTNMTGCFGQCLWSPDGKQILCEFQKKDADLVEMEADEDKKKLGLVSRHYDRVFYKYDGVGYLPHERWHLWLINEKTGKAQQLTNHKIYEEVQPSWSPDGKHIAFLSNRQEDPDNMLDPHELYVMNLMSKKMKQIKTPAGDKRYPVFSPDGQWIAYLAQKGRGQWYNNTNVWIVCSDGKQSAKNITGPLDIECSAWTINDIHGTPPYTKPTWSLDSQQITFQTSEKGESLLRTIDVFKRGKVSQLLIGDQALYGGLHFDKTQLKATYFRSDFKDPGQCWFMDFETDETKCLTELNQSLLNKRELGEVEELWFKSKDGHELQGWILKPSGFNSQKKYPAILEIHGGPMAQYGKVFMHEFYYLAAQGYVVFFCNPRGSIGYGEKHTKAILNQWGTKDYEDIMAFTNAVSRKPYIDSKKLGVTGGSYGGYMTNWIIGHTHKFKAAVTQRCVSNLISQWGASDVNWLFQHSKAEGKPPWENFEHYWEHSPIKHFSNVRTPTLVIHNEKDFRCPIDQGEQVYISLQRLGVDTELVLFPEESHGLSRSGRIDRRIVRLKHIRRWFDKYLKN